MSNLLILLWNDLHTFYEIPIQQGQIIQMSLAGFQIILKLVIDILEWVIFLIEHINFPEPFLDLIDSHIE